MQQGKQTFIRGLHNLGSFQGQSVVTIGSFDGVHVGHRAILRQVRQKASELGIQSIAMTFEPQPREYFSAEKAPARLMRLREKVEALWEIGIDCVVCLQFNQSLRGLSADDFIRTVLVDGLKTRYLIVGDDFKFGCDRSGDYPLLVKAGKAFGFDVQDTATIAVEGKRISSTLIRQEIERGEFANVAEMLGQPFSISGRVVYGQQLGGKLGFPTANVHLHRYRAPLSGVFAVLVSVGDKLYQGAANVGVRPTVGDLVKPILEVHLLDFKGDLYGRRIAVEFVHKIRDEEKFATLDELTENIRRDIEKTRAWFSGND